MLLWGGMRSAGRRSFEWSGCLTGCDGAWRTQFSLRRAGAFWRLSTRWRYAAAFRDRQALVSGIEVLDLKRRFTGSLAGPSSRRLDGRVMRGLDLPRNLHGSSSLESLVGPEADVVQECELEPAFQASAVSGEVKWGAPRFWSTRNASFRGGSGPERSFREKNFWICSRLVEGTLATAGEEARPPGSRR